MLKKRIKYVDWNGEEQERDFYFHISKPELIELQQSRRGGLDKIAEAIIQTKDAKGLIELFKELIMLSYGERDPEGQRFIKSPELSKAFSETPAYEVLYMEMYEKDGAAIEFFNGVVPDMSETPSNN